MRERVESVGKITADDLRAFHARTIARDNLYIVFVGAIDAKTAAAALDQCSARCRSTRRCRRWRRRRRRRARPRMRRSACRRPRSAIGGPGLKRDDPDFITAYVANEILGRRHVLLAPLQGGARESRAGLFGRLRASSPSTMPAPSSPRPRSTRRRSTKPSSIMRDEIARYGSEGPTATELADTKDYLVGNFALRFDSSQKIARNLLELSARRPRHRLYRAAATI